MASGVWWLLVAVVGVGHAVLWTALLNHLYGRPIPKAWLRLWRYLTGIIIAAFPVAVVVELGVNGGTNGVSWSSSLDSVAGRGVGAWLVGAYFGLCLVLGGVVFPLVTWQRWRRKPPPCLRKEQERCYDIWPSQRWSLIGDGRMRWAGWLPGNEIFQLEIREQTLVLPHLPPTWEGLQLLVLSDFHFHGTPSRYWFEQVLEIAQEGFCPDLVCLLGDYVDSDDHREWIAPLLGKLKARWAKLAILGNHDVSHDPEQVRTALRVSGCRVLTPRWEVVMVRDEPLAVIGHEGPWLEGAVEEQPPPASFRLALSHSPDNFYWAVQQEIDLLLCGHVHGGQIRLPVIGPIFVPSRYSRRFDSGVFQSGRTIMVVCRGLSGREPLRYRCRPQILRLSLVREEQ